MTRALFCFFTLLFFLLVQPAAALREFRDDFSAGNFDQWQLINGSWSYWQVTNKAVYATINQSQRLSTLVPRDEFWQGMEEYSVDFIFKVFNGTDKNFVVGMRDAGNFYDFHFYNNSLIIEDIRSGFTLHKTSVPFTLEWNRDYQMHLHYSQEKIELWIDGVKVFATGDSWQKPIYGGKFGLKISTGSVAYSAAFFDEVVVKELDSRDVLFKQTGPEWAGDVYDHGEQWSDYPTMSRYGCAVTSAAMLLRSYGYRYLEDGEILDPGSLNSWLIMQNDGYVAEGLVNWLALSRLTYLLSEQSGGESPKLEFSYFKGVDLLNRLAVLQESLSGSTSQIGTMGGHFFLIDEYLSESDDFAIRDPLFDDDLLSQKTAELESLRFFTPSQTDLSYFLLVLPREVEAILVDALARPLTDLVAVEEEIIVGDEVVGADYRLWYYRQPESGQFNLLLTTEDDFAGSLLDQVKLFFYNSTGQAEQFALLDLLAAEEDLSQVKQLLVEINYDKEVGATLTAELIEADPDDALRTQLRELINQARALFDEGRLSFYLFYQLDLLVESVHEHLNYFFLVEEFKRFYGLQI